MFSHNTPVQKKEKHIGEIVPIYQACVDTIRDLLGKQDLSLIESRCLIRTLAELGEALTYFREVSNDIDSLKSLNFKNVNGDQQSLLTGFTGFRNKLLHKYVYDHLLDYEVVYSAAVTFTRENLDTFSHAFDAAVDQIVNRSTSSTAAAATTVTVASPTLADSSSKEGKPPSVSSASAVTNSPLTNNIILKKNVNKPQEKKSPFNILDQAYFAKREALELESILVSCGLPKSGISTEMLDSAFASNKYLKGALENKVENFCTILKSYNQLYNSRDAIPGNIKHTLYKDYESKLSYKADSFLLSAAKMRISIAHREDVENGSTLLNQINYIKEINDSYIFKVVEYLESNSKLVFNKYINEYEKNKMVLPVVGAMDSSITPIPESIAISPSLSEAPTTVSTSKRGSLVGAESIYELSMIQSKKAKFEEPIDSNIISATKESLSRASTSTLIHQTQEDPDIKSNEDAPHIPRLSKR